MVRFASLKGGNSAMIFMGCKTPSVHFKQVVRFFQEKPGLCAVLLHGCQVYPAPVWSFQAKGLINFSTCYLLFFFLHFNAHFVLYCFFGLFCLLLSRFRCVCLFMYSTIIKNNHLNASLDGCIVVFVLPATKFHTQIYVFSRAGDSDSH